MKKIFFALFSFSIQFVSAQPTQDEIDKMMKQAQEVMKKYGTDSTVNKAMKEAKDKQKEVTDAMKNQQGNNNGLPVNKNDVADFSLPLKNNKLLNALPIRTFNRNELISYLHNLHSKLTEYLRITYKTDINNFSLTAIKQSGTPIGLWMKGKVNESVLVTLKAAELQPDNNLKLNNTGGILTSCGLGYYAIPILEYVLEKQPDNNMILNNLGQAYLDLGDDKKAEQYLLKCIKSYKYYPDANLALAYIYNSRGNKSVALNYVENSLRGAWSSKANTLLKKLKPDANLMDYVKHRYKQPEYFNFHEYKIRIARSIQGPRSFRKQFRANDRCSILHHRSRPSRRVKAAAVDPSRNHLVRAHLLHWSRYYHHRHRRLLHRRQCHRSPRNRVSIAGDDKSNRREGRWQSRFGAM